MTTDLIMRVNVKTATTRMSQDRPEEPSTNQGQKLDQTETDTY